MNLILASPQKEASPKVSISFCPKCVPFKLIFLKRLSDVFEDEVTKLAESYSDTDLAKQLKDEDHGLVRVYFGGQAKVCRNSVKNILYSFSQ